MFPSRCRAFGLPMFLLAASIFIPVSSVKSSHKGSRPNKFDLLTSGNSDSVLELSDVNDDNTFFPFFPGIDPEMNLFGHPSFAVARAHFSSRECQSSRFLPCQVRYENHLPPTGRQFDRRQGAFICSVPGLYYFSFAALSSAFSSARLSLTKNDHEVVSAYAASIGNQMASNSILLLLRPGDKVCVKLFEGHLYESDNRMRAYTTFTGFLVQSALSPGPSFGSGGFGPSPQPFPERPIFGNGINTFGGGGGGEFGLGQGQPLEAGPRKSTDEDLLQHINSTFNATIN